MDVPTPAAPKNDEHFSEKKVFANWIFLAQKYLPYHRLLFKWRISSTEIKITKWDIWYFKK